jgi:transposase
MDEVRFQQYGSRCRMWVPPEVREPVLFHHPTRKAVGYFGAVRLRDGKFLAEREIEKFDAESTWEFYCRLRRSAATSGRRVVVMVDNATYHHARWHKEWREAYEPDFSLFFLPAYSPELNPIERVWKLTRWLCIHNRYFAALTEVMAAVEGCFARWRLGSPTLRTLCSVG